MRSTLSIAAALSVICISTTASAASAPTPYRLQIYDPSYGLINYYNFNCVQGCGTTAEYWYVYLCPDDVDAAERVWIYLDENGTSFYHAWIYERDPINDVYYDYHDYGTYVRLRSEYGLDLDWETGDYIGTYWAKDGGTSYYTLMYAFVSDLYCD